MPKSKSRRTARLTNVHHLWELLAPLVIRMRKEDCGEEIPPKILKPIILQPGTAQAAVYRQHLHHPPLFSQRGRTVHGFGRAAMQLNLLRQAALCPHSLALSKVKSGGVGPKRSWTDFNPKLATTLALVADMIEGRRQTLIGSPFHAFSDALFYRLTEAGVSTLLLDGRTRPHERGDLAERFKTGEFAVLIGGQEAMGEGYNFDNCRDLILPSLSWAMDVNEQFIHRVWRLTSTEPVTIYTLILAGTIDERLYDSFAEKSTSAQLAIDRAAHSDPVEEVDMELLLAAAVSCFNPEARTLDEAAMEEQWNVTLRARLKHGEAHYREWHPPVVADSTGYVTTAEEMKGSTTALAAPSATAHSVAIHRARNLRGAKPVDWNAIERILRREL